ncbi:MAG TPA: hypothetical protein VH394_08735 [Thermoanaerobaculia bacterium]|nr:hypothetical protein [Thermoanaerobaculia bacterium]
MSVAHLALQLPMSDETWQVARFPLPIWVEPDDEGPPFRPWCVVGLRPQDELFVENADDKVDEPPPAERVAEALVEASTQAGHLPRRLLVAEDGLAEDLRQHLAGLRIEVEQVGRLPQLGEVLDTRVQPFFKDDPGFLAGEGVTLEQVASFAEAAASFARAEPWRHLGEMDRIEIESPDVGPMPSALVLGSAGMEHGVVFLPETEEAGSEEPWLMVYMPPWEIPVQDLYTWERHGLALAGENRYPRVSNPGGSVRPGPGLLARFEAFLRAIAVTTEDEMDSGRWDKTVETGRGPVRMILSLPGVLHPGTLDEGLEDLLEEDELAFEDPLDETADLFMAGPEASGPEAKARDLVGQAFESVGRRRLALARQALAIWPDCVDAMILLAERELDPETSVTKYARAMEVAKGAFDSFLVDEPAGDLWDIREARPYMRARSGLAEALWDAGRREEAVVHFEELLRLDDLDHLGTRSRLVDKLLLLDRDREAARLLDACPDEILAHSLYSRTLLAFRREGDSPGARNCLALALARNRFVPEYLLTDEMPTIPAMPLFRPGDRSEAFLYGLSSSEVWDHTPGALDWLRARVSERRKAGRRKNKPRKKKKGRR